MHNTFKDLESYQKWEIIKDLKPSLKKTLTVTKKGKMAV